VGEKQGNFPEMLIVVDLNDIAFVALNEYKNAQLWTGDKVLIKGLKAMGYDRIKTTREMISLKIELRK